MKSSGILFVLLAVLVAGCMPLVLKPADFAWPIEDELKSDSHGMIHVDRYSLSFSIKPLMYAELKDSINVADRPHECLPRLNKSAFHFHLSVR